jgi:DUF1680 family protein
MKGDPMARLRHRHSTRGFRIGGGPRRLREVPYEAVTIDDAFWAPRRSMLARVTVRELFSRFEGADGGAFRNFDAVRDGRKGGHVGFPWYDGLIYETICGASKLLAAGPDEELAARLDGYIRRIADAQAAEPDGYLNTNTTLLFPEKRWGENGGNLRWQHEVYNAGCLVEAAVHHYRATRRRNLLDVAVKLAELMCSYMGPPPRKNIVPAHPLPEDAFVELYRLFRRNPELRTAYPGVREARYLSLARFWIDSRGNHATRASSLPDMQEYAQDHLPLLRQREAVGHAVRATLLYAGMTAVGQETGDDRYLRAAKTLWTDVTTRKMHVTGGVGAMHEEEMFGPAYYLPNNAYLETCAAVGLAWWSHRMGLAFADAGFADAFERALYNNVLACISLDGRSFFYQNPLESGGGHHRWEWHPCPCCPPMFLKLIGGLGGCVYAHDDRGITVNQFVGGSASVPLKGFDVRLRQETRYPWEGGVTIQVDVPEPRRFPLRIRVPGWCRTYAIGVNGESLREAARDRSGYVELHRTWNPGDRIVFDMAMPVTLVEANPYVEADRGRVAIQRGPIVYCFEGVDNPDLARVRLPWDPGLHAEYAPEVLQGVVIVKGTTADGGSFTAVPYYAWANRAADETPPNPMMVWIPREGSWDPRTNVWAQTVDLSAWKNSLYRVCWPVQQAEAGQG